MAGAIGGDLEGSQDKTLAAKLLGIATRTIYRRMKGEAEPLANDLGDEQPSGESPETPSTIPA